MTQESEETNSAGAQPTRTDQTQNASIPRDRMSILWSVVAIVVVLLSLWIGVKVYPAAGNQTNKAKLALGCTIFAGLFVAAQVLGLRMKAPTPDKTIPILKDGRPLPRENADGSTAVSGMLFDLFKLEYEKGLERYERIYAAIWQNFSYMSAIAGAILAFGVGALSPAVVPILVLTPLVFWFTATFLPMDYYGQMARARLGAIEEQLNGTYFSKGGLRHMTDFAGVRYRWRVGHVIKVLGTVACLAWVIAAVVAADHVNRRYILSQNSPTGVSPDSLNTTPPSANVSVASSGVSVTPSQGQQ